MKCPKCGFDNLNNATFCIKCGARLDEKIPCPKCGEYIPNDAEYCPHCGKAIPHKSQSIIEKDEKATGVFAKIARIFNRVSCYVTLFMFIALISIGFLNNFGLYETIGQFANIASMTDFNRTMLIFKASIFLIDFAVVLAFAIVGLTKCHKAFKNVDYINNSYKYLLTCIAAKLLTESLIKACSENVADVASKSTYSTVVTMAILHLTVCLAFDCFLHFKRGQVSIFIARIVLGLSLFLPLLILVSFKETSLVNPNGFIYHYMAMLFSLIQGGYADGFISNFVVASVSFLLAIAIIVMAYGVAVYFVSAYFRGMNKFKRFRIIFYMGVVVLSVLATLYLGSTIVEFFLYQNYLGEVLDYSKTPVAIFICTVLLVGVVITSVNIYNRANRRASLEEKTTLVE